MMDRASTARPISRAQCLSVETFDQPSGRHTRKHLPDHGYLLGQS